MDRFQRGSCSYIHFQFQPDDWLLFGSETRFAADCFVSLCSNCLHPMTQPGVRSLNLSVSVAVGLFEARQLNLG